MSEEGEQEEEKKKGGKAKGKGKEKDDWSIVGGAGRCGACARENTECKINLPAIEKWREEFQDGVAFNRHPGGTNCELCATVRKKPCALPATEKMRAAMVKLTRGSRSRGGSAAPSTTSSSKRKLREVVEVVMPPSKRLRSASAMTQEGFWAEVVRLMEANERRAEESSRAAAERDEKFRATMAMVATTLLQQNKLLVRIEEKLKKGDEEGEEDEEDEDAEDVETVDDGDRRADPRREGCGRRGGKRRDGNG